jgi:hypothetical protein
MANRNDSEKRMDPHCADDALALGGYPHQVISNSQRNSAGDVNAAGVVVLTIKRSDFEDYENSCMLIQSSAHFSGAYPDLDYFVERELVSQEARSPQAGHWMRS